MAATAILGIGHALPSRVIANQDLAARLGLDARAIETRTGITERRYVDDGIGPSDLAKEAAEVALSRCHIGTADLDFLIFATMTPDIAFPGSGCLLQDKLGAPTIGALDIRAQCLGFIFALMTADRFIRAGTYVRVLLAAAEVHSTSLDFSPRGADVTPFFGDGGAAAILGTADDGRGLLAGVMHTDATDYERFWCEYPAGRQYPVRMTIENFRAGLHFPRIDCAALDPVARRLLPEVVAEVIERAGVSVIDIKHFFLHYVSPRVVQEVAELMGLTPDRVTVAGAHAGHIAAASLPIALSRAWGAGAVRSGDLVCLAAVGSGINWGALVLRL